MRITFNRSVLELLADGNFPDAEFARNLLKRKHVDRYDADFDDFCEQAGCDDPSLRNRIEAIEVVDAT